MPPISFRNPSHRTRAILALALLVSPAKAERNDNYVIHTKYSNTVDGYFTTPDQQKARAYFENKKIIDADDNATIPISTQVGFAASTQNADVYLPNSYSEERPVGIYIHISAGNSASLPSNFDAVLEENYLIGGSPDNAGNSQHDMWRVARALDLVSSLKARYQVDDSRVYIGGLSGGALISILSGMLYPDVFTGVIPTEHSMSSSYWQKIFTRDEMSVMAARGQRWCHIIGSESYAYYALLAWAGQWRYHYGGSSLPFFDGYTHVVEGMTHTNAPPAEFETCLRWVDGRAMRSRAVTFGEWSDFAFRPDDPASLRGASDDFDGDQRNNLREFLTDTDPCAPDAGPAVPLIRASGRHALLHYRRNALDGKIAVETSSDLTDWDTTGNGVDVIGTTHDPASPMATVEVAATEKSAMRQFYRATPHAVSLVNLASLPGVSASQSTNYSSSYLAALAIDGDPDGASFSHTDSSTPGNWWEANLSTEREVGRVVIYNRDRYFKRLSNFRIEIKNSAGEIVAQQDYFRSSGYCGKRTVWNLPQSVDGQFIRITLLGANRNNDNVLCLPEVQIIGPQPQG
ncbi:discoidin domain-containing protein [Haloferula chungangensis]|uniref:Discoidin domain-containing protein n=1 Tax=Haloferula chungangensis TaxID=1048331 RepID=A0ABW2L3S2_9BACT